LILRSETTASIGIGRWGQLQIVPGHYAYVGSAFGPGGVLARVSRHCDSVKKMHWHIDYLRQRTGLVSVWYSHSRSRLEHEWAEVMSGLANVQPVAGFGCSDCACQSHLFFFSKLPDPKEFGDKAGIVVKVWSCDARG
jgi:Uri superfamily endonuclease